MRSSVPILFSVLATLLALVAEAAASAESLETRLGAALLEAYASQLPGDAHMDVTLAGRRPADGGEIGALDYDASTERFAAIYEVNGRRYRLAGRAIAYSPLYAPAQALAAGEVIGETDLIKVMTPVRRAAAGAVSSPRRLIGMEARRSLAAGRPITSDMVGPPTLVQKNALVVIEYATGPMLLTAKGKALDDGGKGEVVRVMNIDGSKLIQGVVTGADAVSVSF